MEVFILLVLSVGLCQASPLRGELSRGDPEVVDGVDGAIKSLNDGRSYGNKWGLGVILHAYRIAGKAFLITYQVRETVCPIAADKPWQNCELLRTSRGMCRFLSRGTEGLFINSSHALVTDVYYSGTCTAHIRINELQQSTSISQNCKISQGQENVEQSLVKCVGCWQRINPLSPEVLHIVRHTIRQFNNQNQHPSLFDFAAMKEAESQVVNGVNYRFEYSIKETNCSKNEFADLSSECRLLSGGLKHFCKAKAYVDNRGTLIHSQVDCGVEAEDNRRTLAQLCPGCHGPISADSPELKSPLEVVVKLFNIKSNSDFYFKIVDITKISGKMLVGHVYRIDFKAQKTNCSKAEVQKPDDRCTAVKGGEMMTCHALIYVKPWEPSVVPELTCTDDQPYQAAESRESKQSEDIVTFYDDYGNINQQENW